MQYLFFYVKKFSFWCTNRTIKKFIPSIIKYNIIHTLFSLFSNMYPISKGMGQWYGTVSFKQTEFNSIHKDYGESFYFKFF